MNRKRERELVALTLLGDQEARDILVLETLKITKWVAKNYINKGQFTWDDLVQVAAEAVIHCVDKLDKIDLTKNRFTAYARMAVRNNIRSYLRTSNTIVNSHHAIHVKKLDKLALAVTVSYDNDMGTEHDEAFNFMIEEPPYMRIDLHNALLEVIDDHLTFDEADIILMKFGFGHRYFDHVDWQKPNKPLTVAQIANHMNMTSKMIRDRVESAMLKLQSDIVKIRLIDFYV